MGGELHAQRACSWVPWRHVDDEPAPPAGGTAIAHAAFSINRTANSQGWDSPAHSFRPLRTVPMHQFPCLIDASLSREGKKVSRGHRRSIASSHGHSNDQNAMPKRVKQSSRPINVMLPAVLLSQCLSVRVDFEAWIGQWTVTFVNARRQYRSEPYAAYGAAGSLSLPPNRLLLCSVGSCGWSLLAATTMHNACT